MKRLEAMNKMKLGKAAGPSEVNMDMIIASGKFGVGVIQKLCQRVLDGKGKPEEWKTSVVVPIFKEKGGCDGLWGTQRSEAAGSRYHQVVPRKVMEWALRKKGLAEVLVQAVMSLYEGSRKKVRVGSKTSEEVEVRVGVHQGFVLSPLIFAVVVDVVIEHAREGLLNEILYADDLVLMSESMDDLRERFQKWRSALEGKGLKVNVGKTKMMVSETEGEIVLSKIDLCGICGKRVGSNAVCCTQQCMKWIHGRCTKMKKVTCSSARHFVCRRCIDVGDGTEEPVEILCDEVETVKGFCNLGDKLNASGGCETAVTSRVRIGWRNLENAESCYVEEGFL